MLREAIGNLLLGGGHFFEEHISKLSWVSYQEDQLVVDWDNFPEQLPVEKILLEVLQVLHPRYSLVPEWWYWDDDQKPVGISCPAFWDVSEQGKHVSVTTYCWNITVLTCDRCSFPLSKYQSPRSSRWRMRWKWLQHCLQSFETSPANVSPHHLSL